MINLILNNHTNSFECMLVFLSVTKSLRQNPILFDSGIHCLVATCPPAFDMAKLWWVLISFVCKSILLKWDACLVASVGKAHLPGLNFV
mgnify:CR=1 FL=1